MDFRTINQRSFIMEKVALLLAISIFIGGIVSQAGEPKAAKTDSNKPQVSTNAPPVSPKKVLKNQIKKPDSAKKKQ
jgi:hypothetical protein